MTEHKNIDLNTKRKQYSDILELGIVFAFLFLIICIYVPRAIWDEEELFENESRFYMENMYDVQNFYKSVMGEYDPDGLWAIKVVSSVRDSLTGDSTYLGEQSITLDNKTFSVNVPKGYDIEFDTTLNDNSSLLYSLNPTMLTFSQTLKSKSFGLLSERKAIDFGI